jgi:hypothetical protein
VTNGVVRHRKTLDFASPNRIGETLSKDEKPTPYTAAITAAESTRATFDVKMDFELPRQRPVPVDEYAELKAAKVQVVKLAESKRWSVVNRLLLFLFAFVLNPAYMTQHYWQAILVILAVVLIISHYCEFRS